MTTVLTFLLLAAPFAVAGLLSWAADRAWRTRAMPADPDFRRVQHDTDAIRTRFERQPSWPASGATGERR
ncbi:hypothetical protein [Mycobacterium sp. SMC-4]|uniref:hypothetical protein n=1 Tax=Mycobacterium sp. SMC-4 TaxID=2857059 RepID=UPI003D04E0AF